MARRCGQRGRRNITPEQLSYLRGQHYLEEKKEHGAPQGSANAAKIKDAKVAPLISGGTAEKLAQEHGVSPRTIQHDAAFAEAVDAGSYPFCLVQ